MHSTLNTQHQSVPIAIIGIGCIFPKAHNLHEYWLNIKEGVDAITEVPETHWNPEDYFHNDPKHPDKTYAKRGGFLPTIDFNPLEFGILPNALEATDTSQLLGLVAAHEALKDAGYLNRDFDRDRVSVILGVTGTQELVIPLGARLGHPIWRRALKEAGVDDAIAEDVVERISNSYVEWQESSFPGLLGNVIAGRIANRFDFGGTNCTVDAACASSLSAIHLAVMELANERVDMVLTGGIDTFNHIFMYICFSKTPALSPDGHARPFDHKRDGTTLGEGVGIVVLKRLEDAKRDGDKIYAIIKGMGSSSDGKGTAIYAPSAEGQEKAFRNAYKHANVTPDSIELIEAHGTGTKVGDATEIKSLSEVYKIAQTNGSWCALGSVKSQIGHAKSAAGVAGLIKAAMALHHKVLPPTIKVEKPAPELEPGKTPFYVNTKKRPWLPSLTHPRRAGVSSFGFGGSNFHCVLEEYGLQKEQIDWSGNTEILAFSAENIAQLDNALKEVDSQLSWEKLRKKALQLREKFDQKQPHRLLIVVEHEKSDVAKSLKNAAIMLEKNQEKTSWSTPDGIFYGKGELPGKLGGIFPGQGSQYVGMLRDLACQFPQFQEVLEIANHVFLQGQNPSETRRLSNLIYPYPKFSEEDQQEDTLVLQSTQIAQPAIGAVSLGLLKILEYFGILPESVAGHSYGELVALCAAGVLDTETFFAMSKLRGQLMGQKTGDKGSMLAVQGDVDFVKRFTKENQIELVIANKNAPQQIVLSGATSEVERAANILKERGIRCKQLQVAAAFHSSFVSDASGSFLEALQKVEIHPPHLPVYADSTAELYPKDTTKIRELLAGQLANPVEFVKIIENMYASGVRIFLEVGPSSQMNGLIKAILEGKPFEVISVDTSAGKRSGETDLARVLSQLAALGYDVRLSAWDESVPHEDKETSTSKKRAMAVPISGANYFKQKPPKPPVKRPALRAPNNGSGLASQTTLPSQKSESPVQQAKAQTEIPPVSSPPSTSITTDPSQEQKMEQKPVQSGQPVPIKSGPVAPIELSEALCMTQENLRALQQFQQQTADLHRQFLEGQEATRQTFERLFSQQQHLLLGRSTPSSSQTHQPGEQRSPITNQDAAATPTSDQETPAMPPSTSSSMPVSPEAEPPTTSSPGANSGQTERVLLEVVSEKTGYPVDMLDPDMGLDADLGIDSIKRVEILSALQERLPNAPEITSEQIGAIQNLWQIVEFLSVSEMGIPTPDPSQEGIPTPVPLRQAQGRLSQGGIPTPDPSQEGIPTPDHSQEGNISSGGDSQEVEKVLLEVVSEKTGYPEDMLDLEMGLDADLGIDSIKRVEILSALQERLPNAPEVTSEQIGTIQNLRQIVEFLSTSVEISQLQPVMLTVQPASSGLDPKHVETKLLQVVAEKTGYPEDMLDLDMGLDADLGIDSIKRVEILSALQNQIPDAPEIGSDQISQIQNLRQIVEFLSRVSNKQAQKTTITDTTQQDESTVETEMIAPESKSPVLPLERSLVIPVKLPDPDNRELISLPPGSMIWVTDDGSALTANIENDLQNRGFQTQRISLSRLSDLTVPNSLRGLVILSPPGNNIPDTFLKDAFKALQMTGTVLRNTTAVLVTVSRLDGAFGFGNLNPALNPLSGGLAGLAKTVKREWPEIYSKAIDLAAGYDDVEAAASAVLDEMFRVGPVEAGISPDGRVTLQLEPDPLPTPDPLRHSFDFAQDRLSQEGILTSDDVIVISGGARGITAECAIALAQAYQPTVILLGRSPAPTAEPAWLSGIYDEAGIKKAIINNAGRKMSPKEVGQAYQRIQSNREIQRNIARIEATGAKAVYRSVDVRDANAVRQLVDEVQQQFGMITGMIHGAGVLADCKIEDKTEEQFARVYGTKVEGIENFLSALVSNSLKVLVLFSSTTARLGRVGQVDYAIANEVLNKLAQQQARLRPDCRVVAVNWGPWAGGMVTPQLEKVFTSEGIGLIPLEMGANYLLWELSLPADHSAPVEVVILGEGSVPHTSPSAKVPHTSPFANVPHTSSFAFDEQPEGLKSQADTLSSSLTVAFERTLDVEQYPFLKSHVIDGRAVWPVAITIEWLAHAALHNNPGLMFHGFNDLRVLKGVILGDHESYPIQVLVGDASKDGKNFIVPVEMHGRNPNGQTVRHARAEFILSAQIPAGEPAIKTFMTDVYQEGDIYRKYLFHGPDFQGIEKVEGCSVEGIIARTKAAPHPSAWIKQPLRNHWLTDPLMLDSGFQMMILWSFQKHQAASLPTFAGRYRQFKSKFSSDGGRVVAQVTKSEQLRALATIEFLDLTGNLIARMEDYECTIDPSLNQAFRKNTL